MLYLLRSYCKGGKSILKIGYASDLEDRLKQYLSHNPGVEEVDRKEGGLEDETLLHFWLHYLDLGFTMNEWYIDDPKVEEVFKYDTIKIKNLIWENRDLCFNLGNIKALKIYETLLEYDFGKSIIPVNRGSLISNASEIDKKYFKIYDLGYDIKFYSKYDPRFLESFDIVEEPSEDIKIFLKEFNSLGCFDKKMEILCEFIENFPEYSESTKERIPREYQYYLDVLGVSKIRALQYEELKIKNYIETEIKLQDNKDSIISLFELGKIYTRPQIKEILGDFYQSHGILKTPKASDLDEYFELCGVQVTNKETGKRDNCYKIISLK